VSICRGNGKAIVIGMLERGGKVRADELKIARSGTFSLRSCTRRGWISHITDEFSKYPFVANGAYYHEVINHIEGYVNAHIHT
jgi:hypothetical protein